MWRVVWSAARVMLSVDRVDDSVFTRYVHTSDGDFAFLRILTALVIAAECSHVWSVRDRILECLVAKLC